MKIAPCPSSPNCVCTEATDSGHAVAPFFLARADAWPEIRAAVLELPRTTVAKEDGRALRAECRSALFGFVDDLTLELRAAPGVLAVRSASRKGHYDFGVNRRRVEQLRQLLRVRGVLRPDRGTGS